MNHQRRRQLAEAADALDTIQQLLPTARRTISEVFEAERNYVANIPDPLKGSRRAMEASRIVKELDAAYKQIKDVDMAVASHAVNMALTPAEPATTFGADREGLQRARGAVETLKSGVRGRRRQAAIAELEAALPH